MRWPDRRAFSITSAAGDSTSRRVFRDVSPHAFLVALDRPSTPTTRPRALSGIDRNVAMPPSSSAPSMPSGSAIRGTRSETSTVPARHLTGRAGDGGEELGVLLVRGVPREGDVRRPVVQHQDRREVVVDDPAEDRQHRGHGVLEAEHLGGDGRHLRMDLGLEQLAVEQVADARVHVVVGELDRVGHEPGPAAPGLVRLADHLAHGRTSCGASKSLVRNRSAPTSAPQ